MPRISGGKLIDLMFVKSYPIYSLTNHLSSDKNKKEQKGQNDKKTNTKRRKKKSD